MRKDVLVTSDDGIVKVFKNYVKEDNGNEMLAYITIIAGSGKVHINVNYLEELAEILKDIKDTHQ